MFAYGFEDLTGAEWALLEALAARAEVTVSLPYEPGRDAFASLTRTADDLTRLADGRIEELPPSRERALARARPPRALALQRRGRAPGPELDGSLRFLEGAGIRGTLELVADEILALLRDGTPADEIAIVCPTLDRWRASLDTAFTTLGVPYALEGRLRLGQTPFGQALLSLLRYAWLDGRRRELFAFLRSPYSGLPRHHVDFLEGRLRGRGVTEPERVEEEVAKLRGQPLPHLDAVRAAGRPARRGPRARPRDGERGATGSTRRPPTRPLGSTCARTRRPRSSLAELEGWRDLGGEASREEIVSLLADALGPAGRRGRGRPRGRARPAARAHAALRGRLRRRARRGPPAAPLAGLAVPRRGAEGRARALLAHRSPAAHRPGLARPLPLLHGLHAPDAAALPRPRGCERRRRAARAEPVLGRDARAVRARRDRALDAPPAARRADLAARGRTERARAPARAGLARASRPLRRTSLARANGWERRLDRALAAFDRPTRLTHPVVLEQLRAEVDLRGHRARALHGLLVDVVRRSRPAAEEHRRRGRRRA